jgi:hypothetical protein
MNIHKTISKFFVKSSLRENIIYLHFHTIYSFNGDHKKQKIARLPNGNRANSFFSTRQKRDANQLLLASRSLTISGRAWLMCHGGWPLLRHRFCSLDVVRRNRLLLPLLGRRCIGLFLGRTSCPDKGHGEDQ